MTARNATATIRQAIPAFLGLALLLGLAAPAAHGQGTVKWLTRGSLQNWFSEKGWEIEEGNVRRQQYGFMWPAQYTNTDMQAARGLWLGATNWSDVSGPPWAFKVVHVGPRVNGDNEMFPISYELHARFDAPRVFVDGAPTFSTPEEINVIDPSLKSDRMLISVVNTALGVTMTRRIHQFTQQHHDNYHVFEITLTNTGNTDADAAIELPAQTVTGLRLYTQYRWSMTAETRYTVNNSSGWGINTMNDARGPWYPDAPTDLKAMFAWHGLHPFANKPTIGSYPGATGYDNIGGPIWNPTQSQNYVDPADSTWRLGAAQFVGSVSIHAPTSAADTTNDPLQPTTTNFVGSDDPLTRDNSAFNINGMTAEYAKMSEGHTSRHAWIAEPTGNFAAPTVDPALGTPGGWSYGTGWGPYTLAPGQSVTIVFAEAADGLTREEAVRIGRKFRDGQITNRQKNDSVFTGRDRLFNTFRRAIANYNSGYAIPQPPLPPVGFNVRSGGDRIALSWDPPSGGPGGGFVGYRVYRATGRADSAYRPIFQAGGTAPTDPSIAYSASVVTSYNDQSVTRGVAYYYYIVAFGDPSANTGVGNTPAGSLESSRFYTQTYTPAYLKRQAGTAADQIRIVPNPFVLSSNKDVLRFPDEPDKISFFNIPGNCLIRIYTELGELIKEIDHNDGSGDDYWNSITSSNQVIVSGVYIVVFNNRDNGERTVKKLVVIR